MPPSAAARANELPLERIVRLAEFRKHLLLFLRHSERASHRWGLTPQRYLLLLTIKGAADRSERLSFSEIARELDLSRSAVTELCARAEEAGLVKRERSHADQRITYLHLTKEGERLLVGAIRENDKYRLELEAAFRDMSETFRAANRAIRTRR